MLSILIPTYNYNASPLVDSLLQQGKLLDRDFEIICCDDCSTDEAILAENATIASKAYCTYFRNSKNEGRTKTRTLLAEKAQYDWLLFLDADVLPVAEDFLLTYSKALHPDTEVLLGGCLYAAEHEDPETALRWKFGVHRESQDATVRNKNPYSHILSGNILLRKNVFQNVVFPTTKFYGMDIYFAYQLYLQKVNVFHLNNPVYHLGLEPNTDFFQKSLDAVRTRKEVLYGLPNIEQVNPMLKHYKTLCSYGLRPIVSFGFTVVSGFLKKRILRANPNLFYFDLYRLGYLCTLK